MKFTYLNQLDIYAVGNTIQLYGAIYSGNGQIYLVPSPDEEIRELDQLPTSVLLMDSSEWEIFLHQTDVLDVKGPDKAIIRKSHRIIDQHVAWRVYQRDGYKCRYCDRRLPLTVDHLIRWEDGGPTIEANLVSACRRCNKIRGNREYDEWLASQDYLEVSKALTPQQHEMNMATRLVLPTMAAMKRAVRSR